MERPNSLLGMGSSSDLLSAVKTGLTIWDSLGDATAAAAGVISERGAAAASRLDCNPKIAS